MRERTCWKFTEPDAPLQHSCDTLPDPGPDELIVEVAGCGVCHTDLGFYHGHVRTRSPLPLVLGHEVAGTVCEAGPGAESWLGRDVLVSAVIPCGECSFCEAGRGNICPNQVMPGNDADGGFATHLLVRATGLTPIDSIPAGMSLADFAVIADAVTTPLQAVRRAEVTAGDLVVVVGSGGVGAYAVQIAAAAGADVIAVDIHEERLRQVSEHGAKATVNARDLQPKQVRDAVREQATALGAGRAGWKIFECSGTGAGQQSAYAMLGPAATLAVVGYTREPIQLRLSNLMAFDATAFGSWGCPPQRYPEAVDMVRSGQIQVRPFVKHMPMQQIQQAFEITDAGSQPQRIVLTPAPMR